MGTTIFQMLKTVYGGVVYPSFYDFKNNITSAELKETILCSPFMRFQLPENFRIIREQHKWGNKITYMYVLPKVS